MALAFASGEKEAYVAVKGGKDVGATSTAKVVYHANGQQKLELNDDLAEATGTACSCNPR